MSTQDEALSYARGLRELADWIEKHPDLCPSSPESIDVYHMNTKEEAAKILLALRPCKKEYKQDLFQLRREFGPIHLVYVFYRSAVCTRRVVGTREVGTEIIPARLVPEQVIAAHTEEIVEWDCGESLLSPPDEQASPPSE